MCTHRSSSISPSECGGWPPLRQCRSVERGTSSQAAITEALRLYREDVPHIPLHHQMIPWAMRSNIQIPHMANNQPYFRWAVVQ
jgi:peptide/nickel transport system substrate-binding protein